MDTTTPQGEFLFQIFGALAQFERALIQERVQAGLAAACRRGRRGGRPVAIDAATTALWSRRWMVVPPRPLYAVPSASNAAPCSTPWRGWDGLPPRKPGRHEWHDDSI